MRHKNKRHARDYHKENKIFEPTQLFTEIRVNH